MNKLLIAAVTALALLAAPAFAKSDRATPVADYTVYVDKPTGFVFVKLPAGWKFVGKVGKDEIAQLPTNVRTALLKPERATQAAQSRRTPASS